MAREIDSPSSIKILKSEKRLHETLLESIEFDIQFLFLFLKWIYRLELYILMYQSEFIQKIKKLTTG